MDKGKYLHVYRTIELQLSLLILNLQLHADISLIFGIF